MIILSTFSGRMYFLNLGVKGLTFSRCGRVCSLLRQCDLEQSLSQDPLACKQKIDMVNVVALSATALQIQV